MGLYVQSLENIPDEKNIRTHKEYFIYLLDYGWNDSLADAMINNYERMASIAAENNAIIIRGTQRVHFEDEVLSWHNINGENGEEILPAILITNRHPDRFRKKQELIEENLKLILIPLKKFCKTNSDVLNLIEKLFKDISEKKDLDEFKIAKEIKKQKVKAYADAIILEPNIFGVGISFNKLINFISKK